MADAWGDDDDDEWDIDDDDEIDARLGLKKEPVTAAASGPVFDDEEDLAISEKLEAEKQQHIELKKKGTMLAKKKKEEEDRKNELEIAKEAARIEAEQEANMTPDELRRFKQMQIEQADNALTDDLFGGIDDKRNLAKAAANANDEVILKDLMACMKHARSVAKCLKDHGKIHWAKAFLEETIKQSKDVLDDKAISDLIKTCNVIKNEKVQSAKRKVKGEAQKSKKRDKEAERKAQQLQKEVFGDNDQYDRYDEIGDDYEDAFF